MIERVDDLGRTLRLGDPARRIVCLVPSITETLYAIGVGEEIVGITDYCIHPADGVAGKERVGGTKNVMVDKILALKPDLVIANAEENRKHHIEELESAGIHVFVTFPKTVAGCLKMMRDVAALTGASSEPIVAAIEEARSFAHSRVGKAEPRVLCPIWKNPYMSINRDTFVDSIISEAGGNNVFADDPERYPRFTLEEAARRRPDIVILPTEPYHFTTGDFGDFESLGESIPAVGNRRLHVVEGELLSWYGPRVARALRELSVLFGS
jgi:ABC-type Fe3+-hydroxamate transport system substrate-binding protein